MAAGRDAHPLFPHNVRVYRFILRIVRDATLAEDLVSQVFPRCLAHRARQFEGVPRSPPGCCRSPLQGAKALRQRRHETSTRRTCLKSPTRPIRRKPRWTVVIPAPFCALCVAKLSPAHREIINLVYYHEKSVEEAGAIIGIPRAR